MTSVGYGDVLPLNDEERVYVILLECTGGFGDHREHSSEQVNK